MTSPQTTNPDAYEGLQIIDSEGSKVGKVTTVFLDMQTNQPEWVAVKTGFFGGNETLVPLASAQIADDELRVPYPKDLIKDAPHHDPSIDLSGEDEAEFYRYYQQSYAQNSGPGSNAGSAGGSEEAAPAYTETGQSGYYGTDKAYETTGEATSYETSGGQTERDVNSGAGTAGYDTSGPTTDEAMTRSEERLHVGTERVEAGRARLRKYIVTEQVTQTVPVSHEELRVEREPVTDANVGPATDGPPISEEEHEVVLHAERPVVAKETVPVERVRLGTETVTEEQTVSEQVRKEQIELDGDEQARREDDAR